MSKTNDGGILRRHIVGFADNLCQVNQFDFGRWLNCRLYSDIVVIRNLRNRIGAYIAMKSQ